MNVKDTIEAEILSNGMDGEGIARVDGKVVFVPYTLKGERVRAVVKAVKKNYAEAAAVKILEPSARRVKPSCPHYYKCGGCDTCHIDGEYRREVLIDELKNNFRKIADMECPPVKFVSCGSAVRNKIAMPFGSSDGGIVLGMYKKNSHDIVPVDCEAASALTREVVRIVCAFCNEKRLSVYDGDGNGVLRHLVVRHVGRRASVTLVINAKALSDGFERALYERLPEECDFFICSNTRKGNSILSDTVRLVGGNPKLKVNVLGVEAELSPLSFFQVNDEIRDKLYTAVLEHVSSPTLVDLYSGIGITSNLAARKCEKVIAVECVSAAVKDAEKTAALNGNADKIVNICGDAEKVLPGLAARVKNADVLVDPPRKGCDAAVMNAIAEIAPKKLIYVSCNHATMCRDIKMFNDKTPNYRMTELTLFDMFVNTHHVETLACLERI